MSRKHPSKNRLYCHHDCAVPFKEEMMNWIKTMQHGTARQQWILEEIGRPFAYGVSESA